MKNPTFLLFTASLTLWAQAPHSQPDLSHLRDLDIRLNIHQEKLVAMQHEVAARASAKATAAMSKLDFRMPARHERGYEQGLQALDRGRYEQALEAFSQASAVAGARTDGALYWKAYALDRLGRREDALAVLAELRKSHASSRWSADAQTLEAAIKQTTSQKDAAQRDAEEELKVLALAGLLQSDPDKGAAVVEQILKSSPSRKLKEQALQSIANGEAQRNRDLLAQVAQGKVGNPDLQIRAIRYLGNRRNDNRQLLREVYSSATDESLKRATLRAISASGDKEQLLLLIRSEKEPSIRMEAVSLLGDSASQAELWTLYQAETSVEVKERILHRLKESGATERLLEVAKSEKDPMLRRYAIHTLGSVTTGDALAAMHGSETDPAVKRAILDALYSHKNAKALVDLARKENDPQQKREIVSRLSRIQSKEASDYLMEILK